jgi:hypothetical protein
MRDIENFFDSLFFSECVLGPAYVQSGTLHIPVHGLLVLGKHPLANEGPGPYEGELIFQEVVSWHRKVTEYIGDARKPEGFKPVRKETDALLIGDLGNKELHEFGLEGYQESPSAWIDDWCIRAGSFRLRVK